MTTLTQNYFGYVCGGGWAASDSFDHEWEAERGNQVARVELLTHGKDLLVEPNPLLEVGHVAWIRPGAGRFGITGNEAAGRDTARHEDPRTVQRKHDARMERADRSGETNRPLLRSMTAPTR